MKKIRLWSYFYKHTAMFVCVWVTKGNIHIFNNVIFVAVCSLRSIHISNIVESVGLGDLGEHPQIQLLCV